MPYSKIGDKTVYFCHVPKTGGRSVELWMEQNLGNLFFMEAGWTDMWKQGGWRRRGLGTSRQHMDWATAEAELDHVPDHVFAIIREPMDRLVSEFRFQSRHRRKRRALTRLGFDRWCRIMFVASRLYPLVFDNHFRNQCDLVPARAKVFRFEDGLEAVTAWLTEISPGLQPGHDLRGPEQHGPKRQLEITPEDKNFVEYWYAQDYDRFGFSRSNAVDKPRIPIRDWLMGALVALAFRIGRI